MSEEKCESKPTITLEQVISSIESIVYSKVGKKTTVGVATLKNGFEIVESSSCVCPENYNEDIGHSLVEKIIYDRVWMLLGFNLQECLYSQCEKTQV